MMKKRKMRRIRDVMRYVLFGVFGRGFVRASLFLFFSLFILWASRLLLLGLVYFVYWVALAF